MLLELSIVPLGRGRSISADVAELDEDYRCKRLGLPPHRSWNHHRGNLGSVDEYGEELPREMRKKTDRSSPS